MFGAADPTDTNLAPGTPDQSSPGRHPACCQLTLHHSGCSDKGNHLTRGCFWDFPPDPCSAPEGGRERHKEGGGSNSIRPLFLTRGAVHLLLDPAQQPPPLWFHSSTLGTVVGVSLMVLSGLGRECLLQRNLALEAQS